MRRDVGRVCGEVYDWTSRHALVVEAENFAGNLFVAVIWTRRPRAACVLSPWVGCSPACRHTHMPPLAVYDAER